MYGDFSRFELPRRRPVDGVWFQQGRVQLDADLNELSAALRHRLATLTRDLVGPYGGPWGDAGFAVSIGDKGDLVFSVGHYYALGSLLVLQPLADGRPVTMERLTGMRPRELPDPPYLVYLQAWDQTVSVRADPRLAEPALGPDAPDTVVRSRFAWRPRVTDDLGWLSVARPKDSVSDREWVNEVARRWSEPTDRPTLQARAPERDPSRQEASVVSPAAGYRGIENQLYRVEIHRPTVGPKHGGETFKWSRDNGSVEFGIVGIATSAGTDQRPISVVTLDAPPRDGRSALAVGEVVEVVEPSAAPFGQPGPLLVVDALGPEADEVTLRGQVQLSDDPTQVPRAVLRRWDQPAKDDFGDGIPIDGVGAGDGWVELEDGVQVRFSATNPRYRRGDYWLIPARTATASVIWPRRGDAPAAIPPWGPERRYVPLALVTATEVVDLRTLFVPIAVPDATDLPIDHAPPTAASGPLPDVPPAPADGPAGQPAPQDNR